MMKLIHLSRKEKELLAAAYQEKFLRAQRALQTGRGGLIEFVKYFWHILEPVTEYIDGIAVLAICEHLEAVEANDINRLLVNVSPGFMKSLLTNVFFPAWVWGPQNRASSRFVTFSYSSHLTQRDNEKFRDLVSSREYQELWGDRVKLKTRGKIKVSNFATGWKFASSVSGVGTGERGDFIILDDPHNVKEGNSKVIRESTTQWFKESMQSRLNDLSSGSIIVIMQRVHEADVSGVILDEYPNYEHLCIPMEYEPERHCTTRIGWTDWRSELGELAWPERFKAADLDQFKSQAYSWAGQYQQRPEPRGGGVLPRAGWEYWDDDLASTYGRSENQFPDIGYIVASLDSAYTEKSTNDYSALVVQGVWNDYNNRPKIIVMSAWQERLELNALVQKVIETCRKLKVDKLLIEAKASGHSVAQEIRRMCGNEDFAVQMVNPIADKTARAYSIQHLLGEDLEGGKRRNGIVYVPCLTKDGAVYPRQWADMLISQAASFPKGAHDDLVDAFVQGLRYLRNTGLARRSDEIDFEDAEFITHKSQKTTQLYPV